MDIRAGQHATWRLRGARSDPWWVSPARSSWLVLGVAIAIVVSVDGSASSRLVLTIAVAALAAGGWWLSRRQVRLGGVLALAVGTIATVAGAALGARFVLADSISARSVAAVVAMAPAGVLLVSGGAAAAGGLGWRWKVPVFAAMVIGVVLVGFIVAPGLLATNVPHVDGGLATPADRGIAYEDVTTRTSDGVTLTGWYVPSRNGAGLVLRHGSNATSADELDHLEVLVAAGFGVLVTDSRGHGRSDGQGMDFGWSGDPDLRAAVDFLAGRPDVDPERIGVVGISLGGMEAIGAAAGDPRIVAVVAEGATRRSAADLAWLPAERGVVGTFELAINWLQTGVTDLLSGMAPPPRLGDSVAAATGTLFLLVQADNGDEIACAAFIEDGAPDRVTIWVVPGAGHARGLQSAPEEWTTRVVGFLSDALLEASLAR